MPLGDARFGLQRSGDGRPTSWFRLRLPSWDVIGLDTAWNDDPFEQGQTGLLQDPQATQLSGWIGDDDGPRRRLVLSHHQFMTVYDRRLEHALQDGHTPALLERLQPLVEAGAITAWIWGHEHRCMAFEHDHLPYPRCLGHGGQLLQAHAPGTRPPAPGVWEETASFAKAGHRWGAFGFAALDVDGPDIEVRYVIPGGEPVVATERFG